MFKPLNFLYDNIFKIIIALAVLIIIIVIIYHFVLISREISYNSKHTSHHDESKVHYDANPITGNVGGISDFAHRLPNAHYDLRTHIQHAGGSDITSDHNEIHSYHKSKMKRQVTEGDNSFNSGENNLWEDSSPFASLGEIAQYKIPYSIGGANNINAFNDLMKIMEAKNNISTSAMYEQDMLSLNDDDNSNALRHRKPYYNIIKPDMELFNNINRRRN